MRAPGSNGLAYAFQGFLDEVAFAAKQDPMDFNLAILGEPRVITVPPGPFGPMPPYDTGRFRGVIEAVREKSGWEKAGLHALARQGSPGKTSVRAAHRHGFRVLLLPPGLFRGSREGDRRRAGGREGRQGLGGRRCRQPDRQPERRAQPGAGWGAGRHRARRWDWPSTSTAGRSPTPTSTSTRCCACTRRRQVEVHFLPTNFPPTGLG